jgi:membrane-anchored protein YejM (alkaline phosphatase superfamily)
VRCEWTTNVWGNGEKPLKLVNTTMVVIALIELVDAAWLVSEQLRDQKSRCDWRPARVAMTVALLC